jgi:hypothetical protein
LEEYLVGKTKNLVSEGCNGALGVELPSQYLKSLCVANVIHQDTKAWNFDVIHTIFDSATAAKKLQVLLFETVRQDKLVWKEDKCGHYSITSAYCLCMTNFLDMI